MKMSDQTPFTIEQFYRNINQQKLLGAKCLKCGKIHLPPRPLCSECFSQDFEWSEIPAGGKLLTYTIIHIAPTQFQSMAPYATGIVQLKGGTKLPGMIKEVPSEKIKIGMELTVEFEKCEPSQSWPRWPRYYFKPV